MVACLDGAPITVDEVEPHLRLPAAAPGTAARPDPRRAALDAAIRVRLFAAEAERRGLSVPTAGAPARRRAALHQALIRDEAARRGAVAGAIGDAEARAAYEATPGRFNKITGTWVRAIIVADPARAEALFARVAGADDATFAAVAREASQDASAAAGGDLGEAHDPGLDPALRAAANDLRAEGAIVGPVELADGRWAILRATRLELTIKPWDDAVARAVKNQLAHDRAQAALDALHARLARGRRVEVLDAELARLPAP